MLNPGVSCVQNNRRGAECSLHWKHTWGEIGEKKACFYEKWDNFSVYFQNLVEILSYVSTEPLVLSSPAFSGCSGHLAALDRWDGLPSGVPVEFPGCLPCLGVTGSDCEGYWMHIITSLLMLLFNSVNCFQLPVWRNSKFSIQQNCSLLIMVCHQHLLVFPS